MSPLVSVILPTYNRAQLLPRAVQSVLTQEMNDLELIIIDDGSTDETPEIIRKMSDSRIKYVRFQQNQGIGFGRNEGVRQAKGELIAFIDSDDVWLPGKLAWQVRVMQTYPYIEFLFGNYWNINYTTRTRDLGLYQTVRGLERLAVQKVEDDLWKVNAGVPQALLISNFIGTSTVIFRYTICEKAGNFNSKLSGPEDFEFWWRVSSYNVCFAYTKQPLAERHKDEGSITTHILRFTPRYLKALDVCEQTAQQANRPDLLPFIQLAQHKAWCILTREYALLGKRRASFRAFTCSLRYGFSKRAWFYLLGAIIGPVGISLGQHIKQTMRRVEHAG